MVADVSRKALVVRSAPVTRAFRQETYDRVASWIYSAPARHSPTTSTTCRGALRVIENLQSVGQLSLVRCRSWR